MIEFMATIIMAIATVIMAIATVTLVIVTRRYAKATERYAEITEKALKAADTPNVKIYLSSSSSGTMVYTLDLCIHNIGTGFAYDVKFTGDFLSFSSQFNNAPLAEYEIMRNGIDFFAPGKQCRIALFFQYEQKDLPQRTFNMVVDYRDSVGERHESEFELDFTKVESYPQVHDPSLYSIASSLKFIYEHFLDMKKERDSQNQQR